MKRVFQIVLVILVVFLAILAFRSIMRPEKFRLVYELRKSEIRNRLTTIRVAQAVYKSEYQMFATHIDTLVNFVNNGMVTVVKNVGTIPENMSEADAFKAGLIKKEVSHIPAKDKILETDPLLATYIKDFQFIPFNDGKKFEIQSGTLKSSSYNVPVYKIEVPLDEILANMDESIIPENMGLFKSALSRLIYNGLSEEKQYKKLYKDMYMGSLIEASTAGSWEIFGDN